MLKKIALTALFAITFAVGMGAAQAATHGVRIPHGLCGAGRIC
jgi:hypothetical protein